MQSTWPKSVYFSNDNFGCVAGQTQASNGVAYDAGTFVWTGHDYIGEPGPWPHVSSSFGSYDLSGFPKAPVYWYRSWWLANVSTSDAGRPPIPDTAVFLHIVEAWQPPPAGTPNRTIHVLSNAPAVRLSLNGVTIGTQAVTFMNSVVFSVRYAAGSLTAEALDGTGGLLASTSRASFTSPALLRLSIDAPALTTGTGSFVMADGADVALVRVTVLDANAQVVSAGSINVTLSITGGPGVIWGSGNGDPADQTPHHATTKPTYHGLVRAVVRSSVRVTGSAETRALEAMLNPEAGIGPLSSSIAQGSPSAPGVITLTASAPGLPSASIQIPLSIDPNDAVLAVATRSVASGDIGA